MNEDIINLRTRCGYKPSECFQAFEKNLQDSGIVSSGKCIHFGIDLICSGGLHTFFKIVWNYALNNIGIASIRIFMYLNTRMIELDDLVRLYPDESLYTKPDFQNKIIEMILILHDAPKQTKLVWPKVGSETHDPIWLRSVSIASDTEIVNKVWKSDGDLMILRIIGNEICRAIADHSLDKVLFWMKWGFEEEARMKKENHKGTLTTVIRGNGTKHETSYYFLSLFVEYYKEFARKQQIRMHEEFQSLVTIFKNQDNRFTALFKKNLLGLIARIVCEVPRWKIPAAPPLIKDIQILSHAVSQSPKLFTEVLQYPSVSSNNLQKLLKNKGKSEKQEKKKLSIEEQFNAFDKAMEEYMLR